MRVTGGTLRGRHISAPEGLGTRPTTDRVREALFNILSHHDFGLPGDPIENAIVLDAFAGTGALGIEALSRGASQSIFFEKDGNALIRLKKNIQDLSLFPQSRILSLDATAPPKATRACTLIFLDPPYRKNLIPLTLDGLAHTGWIHPQALIVTETDRKEPLPAASGFQLIFHRSYGDTVLGFMTKTA